MGFSVFSDFEVQADNLVGVAGDIRIFRGTSGMCGAKRRGVGGVGGSRGEVFFMLRFAYLRRVDFVYIEFVDFDSCRGRREGFGGLGPWGWVWLQGCFSLFFRTLGGAWSLGGCKNLTLSGFWVDVGF